MITEPATIREIAEWMRDGAWLDMRTPIGRAERVRVVRLLVTYEADLLTVEQQWFGDDDKIHRKVFEFDAEDCWDCRATTVDFLDVRPLEPPKHRVKKPLKRDEKTISQAAQEVINAVIQGALVAFSYLQRDLLLAPLYEHPTTHHRHQVILLIYEMTDLSGYTICTKVFGYRSPMPYQSASHKLHGRDYNTKEPTEEAKGMRAGMQTIANRADELIAHFRDEPARRTKPFPSDYRPVLKR